MTETARERAQAVRIRELLAQIIELEERLALFESATIEAVAPDLRGILTKSEAIVLGILMQRDVATKEQLMVALYANRKDTEIAHDKIIDIFIHKVRRKIGGHGIEIRTHWGIGYSLTPESKVRVREMAKETA